jgi:hypothetical protein
VIVTVGAVVSALTVKLTPLLLAPPTVTTTFPLVAPLGTVATMLVALQLVAVAFVPLKLTVLVPRVPPKLLPAIVTDVPTTPVPGLTLVMLGDAALLTVKFTPLLLTPPTVTTTFPLVAPLGTGATMLVALQLVAVAFVPLKLTVLVPCVPPKLLPAIVTDVPTTPAPGLTLVILGAVCAVPVPLTLKAATMAPHGSDPPNPAAAVTPPATGCMRSSVINFV